MEESSSDLRWPFVVVCLVVAVMTGVTYFALVPAWEPKSMGEQSELSVHIDMNEAETRAALDAVSSGDAEQVQVPTDKEGNNWSITRPAQIDVASRNPFASTVKEDLCLTAVAHEVRAYERQGGGEDAQCDFAEAESWWVLSETESWAPEGLGDAERGTG